MQGTYKPSTYGIDICLFQIRGHTNNIFELLSNEIVAKRDVAALSPLASPSNEIFSTASPSRGSESRLFHVNC